MNNDLRERIFSIRNNQDFESVALDIYRHQFKNNKLYRKFAELINRTPSRVSGIEEIPFLPVEFFRNNIILSGVFPVDVIFESSGTAGTLPGRHFVKDLTLYEQSFMSTFRMFYGDPENYIIAALLPSYIERRGSSLVYMADSLIRQSGNLNSGFYRDMDAFVSLAREFDSSKRLLVLGVSFALLDLAEGYSPDLSGAIVMETGGMKGRRKEITRDELHLILREKLNVKDVHSEYGMTELMSQAYSRGNGVYQSPPWMKVLIRDPQDALTIFPGEGKAGGINIIDLANLNSCSFLATSDLGRLNPEGGFEVLGRFDYSDIRGCNLMVE